MRDEKKQQSIRAARDWLDEADASLSKGSGIRGDLTVMLAQAELRHAQEDEPEARGTVWRRRLARLLPLTAAAVIAALAFYLTPAVAPPQETAGISMPPAEMQEQPSDGTEAAVPSEAAAEDGSTAEMSESTPPSMAAAAAPAPEAVGQETGRAAAVASSGDVPAASRAPSQAAAAATRAAPAVPAPETQKLMQTAGKALREP